MASSCKQTEIKQTIEPYAHNYTYRKGDPCPYGRNNTKIGESNNANGDSRRWRARQDPENRGDARGTGELSTGSLYQRGHRSALIKGRGYPVHTGEAQR